VDVRIPLFLPEERPIAEDLAGLAYANPFQSEFLTRQRDVLGPDHASEVAVWSHQNQTPDLASGQHDAARVAAGLVDSVRDRRRPSSSLSCSVTAKGPLRARCRTVVDGSRRVLRKGRCFSTRSASWIRPFRSSC